RRDPTRVPAHAPTAADRQRTNRAAGRRLGRGARLSHRARQDSEAAQARIAERDHTARARDGAPDADRFKSLRLAHGGADDEVAVTSFSPRALMSLCERYHYVILP